MDWTVCFGGMITVAGLYTLLSRPAYAPGQLRANDTSPVSVLTSPAGSGLILTVTGILIILAVTSRPAGFWSPSILSGNVATVTYWMGTPLATAGMIVVAFARTDLAAGCGMVVATAGAALLFGLVGNVMAGAVMILLAAAAGGAVWSGWLTAPASATDPPQFPADRRSPAQLASEPLLLATSVSAILILTTMSVHHAVTMESRPAIQYGLRSRSLPRPATARARLRSESRHEPPQVATSPGSGITAPQFPNAWQSIAPQCLLLLVAVLGAWQQLASSRRRPSELPSADRTSARIAADATTPSRQPEGEPS